MMKHNRIKLSLIAAVLLCLNNAKAEGLADILAENTKFNVVIGVLILIFVGIVVYLFRLDRKVKQLENKNKDTK